MITEPGRARSCVVGPASLPVLVARARASAARPSGLDALARSESIRSASCSSALSFARGELGLGVGDPVLLRREVGGAVVGEDLDVVVSDAGVAGHGVDIRSRPRRQHANFGS
jgi:hypothetical protein